MEILFATIMAIGGLIAQIPIPGNCVFEFTCLPDNPLEVFTLYKEVYGISNTVTLGLILGIINAALYLHNRSVTMLAIVGTYTVAALGATWAEETAIAAEYGMAIYVLIFGVATGVVIFFLKVLRE